MSNGAPVLPEVETAEPTEPAVDETPETPTEPEADALPEVDDALGDAEELAGLREMNHTTYDLLDALRSRQGEVEDAKGALKLAKAHEESATKALCAHLDQSRFPLFDDQPAKDAASGDDDEWRNVEIIDLDVSSAVCKVLAENPKHPITTLGDLSDWCNLPERTTTPYQDIPGIGGTKAEELTQAYMAFWEARAEDAPVAEVAKAVCQNCGSEEFDEDGDCVSCHEPEAGPPGPPDVREEI